MKYPHLIILYGKFSNKLHEKQQRMVEGKSTCMYREFGRRFGKIIYLAKQECTQKWDKSITNPIKLFEYLKLYPDSIIWSVKHDPEKDKILRLLPNKKVYYSCCTYNMYNPFCDISLVDTTDRIRDNAHLWVKGKDPDFWYPVRKVKLADYLFIGKRGDKNEIWFINQLTKEVRQQRTVLWIGGEKHASKIKKTHHKIICTPFKPMPEVRDLICTAKVGVILSEIPAEGFPQTFLEMTMVGVPVVYMGPYNKTYSKNCYHKNGKDNVVEVAEEMLIHPKVYCNPRQYATENYSLEKSYESILRGLKCVT